MSETNDTETLGSSKSFSRTPTSWEASDDILLMHLKDNQKLGWKEIASHFQNRTPNACQFRWRRLKSGNLKNPPKSGAAASKVKRSGGRKDSETPSVNENVDQNLEGSRHSSVSSDADQKSSLKPRLPELSPGITNVYSPLSNTTFTGYNTVQTALAGLNALSNQGVGGNGSTSPKGPINTTSHPQTFDNSPQSEVALDPQAHSAAAGTHGGYFTNISVDPTSNLPHNKPHPGPNSQGMTPRHSAVDHGLPYIHNNSIIQIVRDDRASVSSQSRHSVSSLPSKSMDIPHHHRNSLAHMPVLFGGSSISGPAGSISGPSGLPHLASTLSGIRKGSIVGPAQAYLRRSSMSNTNSERRLSEKDRERKSEKEKSSEQAKPQSRSESGTPSRSISSASQPVFKIPWSMEEDELLINRRRKELSFAELSILLPQRTEGEIWGRIDALERLKNGHRGSVSRSRRRQSVLGLDDVDDFYDDVDSVIDGMNSEDYDEDVLLDVDDSIHTHHRISKKRRASSSVNPLSVRDSIRPKLH